MFRLFFSGLLLPLCLLLTACGQRGPLYLPTESRAAPQTGQSTAVQTSQTPSEDSAAADTAVPTAAPDNPPYVTPVPPIQ